MPPNDCGPFNLGEWVNLFAVVLTFLMVVLIAIQAYIMHRQTELMFTQAEIQNRMAKGERADH